MKLSNFFNSFNDKIGGTIMNSEVEKICTKNGFSSMNIPFKSTIWITSKGKVKFKRGYGGKPQELK